MKTIIYIISAIFNSVALGGVPGIFTPSPVQSGFPSNCEGFAMAIPGDTCDSLAQKHGLDTPTLLSLNPQIGGYENCPRNLFADYWYCMHAELAPPFREPPPPPTQTADPRKTLVHHPPPATTTGEKQGAPAAITTPPPSCPTNDCWRAFRKAADRVKPSYSSWCSSVLAPPAILDPYFDDFPGAPNMVKNQCTGLGYAHTVISSYCRCYTAGQMD